PSRPAWRYCAMPARPSALRAPRRCLFRNSFHARPTASPPAVDLPAVRSTINDERNDERRPHNRHAADAAGASYRLLPERARHGWRARSLQDEFTAVRQEAIWRTRGTATPNDREKTPQSCRTVSRGCETEPTEGRKNPSAEVR